MKKIRNFVKNNVFIYKIYFYIFSNIIKIISLFIKVDDKSIMFVSYGGKKYDDSPKVIYEEIKKSEKFKDYKLFYAFIEPNKYLEIENKYKVKIDSLNYYYKLLKCKYWITNSSVQRGLNFKNNKHKYILFMHGLTALKKSEKNFNSEGKQFKMVKPEEFDMVFIEGKKERELVLNNINVKKEQIYNYGLPRIDELISFNNDIEYKKEIKKKIGISEDKKIILYAPTYREYNKTVVNGINAKSVLNVPKWKKELSDEYVLLLTSHYEISNNLKYQFDNNFLFDVSKYNSFNELLSVSDILVTDYSNIVFDNYILEKPAFCFGYDYEEYTKKGRKFYTELDEIYYDGIIKNEKELIYKIKNINLDKYKEYSKRIRNEFIFTYGNSTQKCINQIFNLLGDSYDKKINILHINNNTNIGGQQQVVMDILNNLNKNKFKIDLAVYDSTGPLSDKIKNVGCNIFVLPSITKHPILHIKELKKILKHNSYDVVHQHSSDSSILINLMICKKMGIKKVILHSHSSFGKHKIIHYVLRTFIKKYTNYNIACSDKAGKWMFKNEYYLIKNAVDFKKFRFDQNYRDEIRKELSVDEDTIILGHIGRFSKEKNQKFLIDIMKKLSKKRKYLLLLVGDGKEKKYLEEYVKKLNIENSIKFLGIREDNYKVIQAIDIFLLPSLFEGLPVTLVEAQISGCKSIISENITDEAIIINTSKEKLDLDKWIERIEKTTFENRNIDLSNKIFNDFNEKYFIKKIEKLYEEE